MWTAPDAPTCISEQASFTENLGFGPLGKAATCLRFKHLFIHPLAAPRTTQVHLGAKSYIRRQNDCGLPPAASSTVWNWLREIAQTRSKVLQFFFLAMNCPWAMVLDSTGLAASVKHVSSMCQKKEKRCWHAKPRSRKPLATQHLRAWVHDIRIGGNHRILVEW